jgi:hypothetical protein
MSKLSKEKIQEFKDILEKKTGKEITWEAASDGAYNLAGFAELMFDLYVKEQQRKKKLEEFPKGFHLEGIGYTCFICKNSISNEETWYDEYGVKCLICQKAIDEKIIPATIAENEDDWYSKYDLEDRFNINRHTLNKFVKQGILKPRIIPNETGKPHVQIFLIEDNKDTLPPKKLTESQMVKETKDEKDWYHSEPWYRFVDPYKHLKDYKIMDYLKVTHEEKKESSTEEIKNRTMKIKELFKVGDIMQSVGGMTIYLDRNNCVVYNKSRNEDAVILHLKREVDGEEGNAYLRVRDEFKSIKDQLLDWAFASSNIMGLTLNQLESLDTNLNIESLDGKLTIHKNNI